VKVDEKSNEITAIPELLELLELQGCIVTIDAMGTQKAIAQSICDKGAEYVLALKGNQGTLNEDIELYFQDAVEQDFSIAAFDYHKTVDKDHGRIEIRECWVTDDIDWLSMKDRWVNLQSICMMKNQRMIGEQRSEETLLYISSLKPQAEIIGEVIRKHWRIESAPQAHSKEVHYGLRFCA
jgi:predicted transposase YbfD/YdcC